MKYNQKNHMIQKQGGQGFMSKQVYISADYSIDSGDRDVVAELNKWGSVSLHK